MSAFKIIKSDDGLSYHIEWDVHYITDEQIETIGAYVGSLQEDNAKLRELCLDLWASCPVHDEDCQDCKHYDGAFCDLYVRMEELEVTA